MLKKLCLFMGLFLFPSLLFAQSADLSGYVKDPAGASVPGASIEIRNQETGVRQKTTTNKEGIYYLTALKPGTYVITVQAKGFKTLTREGVVLNVEDRIDLDLSLQVGEISERVTVNANDQQMESDSPGVSMTVTREFVEDMPLNGRSFQDLIQLAPGTVSTTSGYYSINGQRSDSNNFTVDGVSANLGGYNNTSSGGSLGSGLSGSSPLQTALGTTQSLASVDSLQEFKIETSGYSSEYGRNPGGQVAFTTRSGTNDIHGTLFDYFRNEALDANSWANDYYGIAKTAERQNDFGGTIGGPLIIPRVYDGKNKTFYFFSYEGLRLVLPAFESEYVPTVAFRDWASPNVRPYLDSSPLPNPNSPGNQDGCTIPDPSTGLPTACDALFTHGYSYPNSLDNISVRIDQNFGERLRVFLRYADTPSSYVQSTESVFTTATNVHSWTAGATANITSMLINDLRFNYTYDHEFGTFGQQALNGSIPTPRDLLIPASYESPSAGGGYQVSVPGSSLQTISQYSGTVTSQHQYQVVDSLAWSKGNHGLKFGVDWRRLTPTYSSQSYTSGAESGSLADIQQGYATDLEVSASAPGQPVFVNLSLYAQDRWKISPRLSVDYGLRWEFNPPPGPSNGHYPATLTSSNLAIATLAPSGTAPYKTSYNHFAPRFGFAWTAIPNQKHALTLRAGFGIFYDSGQQLIGNSYANSYPFQANGPTLMHVALPLSEMALAPPSLNFPLTPPYPTLFNVSDPNLTLPYTEQWNISLDEALNPRNTLTVSYVGNNGRKLLFTQAYNGVPGNPNFTYLFINTNEAQSSYNALQVQDRGRIANGLDLVGSYTYAHALDNQSSDYAGSGPIWGNSAYDLRQVLNLALNYQTAAKGSDRWLQNLTHGWVIANRFSAQSGYPLDVYQSTQAYLPSAAETVIYPDLVPGVPIYLHGQTADVNGVPVPGNWRINSAAFAPVPTDANGNPIRQGNLGRNYVRNPPFWSLNTAVQRSFPIYEHLNLNFRIEAFNIFNHPSLGGFDNRLSDSTFGQLGGVTTIGSSNPLYSTGAARSLQLSLRLQF